MIAPAHLPWRQPKPSQSARKRLALSEMPAATYVIGDIHGRFDLYRAVENWIVNDAKRIMGPALIVVLGDMVDRGLDSANLLDHLIDPPGPDLQRLCLMGNHEHMMLEFLVNPSPTSPWLTAGGWKTLRSYGIISKADISKDVIDEYIPQFHVEFLQNLPICLQVGPYFLSHAGADPEYNLKNQPEDALIWGTHGVKAHPDTIIVHGHTAVERARNYKDRIALDTRAYATNVLSAVRLMPDAKPLFIETARHSQGKIIGDPHAGH
ncbi:metallophosphoesterase [Parasulfitobacter algicola]|uniref:Metallophosphoesterase n=1 Tax=Parasulfitobacter algicola TaxID=2614809 RepID=A0ABX2IKX1_9RHOB|nr:metallophosphoesterase [Sulfitobacter algicola]NSX53521.1 metallophosphoesterase [Sulfitobacter algicola]